MSGRVNCPRCNSLQDFTPHLREVPNQRWMEEYVRCHVCGHEVVIRETTVEIDRLGMRYRGLLERVRYESRKHGQPTNSTMERLCQTGIEWNTAREMLKADVEESRGG